MVPLPSFRVPSQTADPILAGMAQHFPWLEFSVHLFSVLALDFGQIAEESAGVLLFVAENIDCRDPA